jgi:phosphatidylglycerophosphate synthase
MLDAHIRPIIDKPLNYLGKQLSLCGISANHMTLTGFVCGGLSMFMIMQQYYNWGAFFLCLNRLADGVDGAIARHKGLTDFGGYLDIVCDFIIYAGVVYAFGVANIAHMPMANLLLFSLIGPMVSFLAYAIITSKKGISTQKRGRKSFYYLGGLCEGTETALFLLAMCCFSAYFNPLAILFSMACWITTAGRVYAAYKNFV